MDNKVIDFSTSEIELRLEEILNSRPDLKNKILSSEELGEYIKWLVVNFGENNIFSLKDLNIVPCSEKMNTLAKNIFENHDDTISINELKNMYGPQYEKNYFEPENDISVSRQIRYMPAHWHSNDYFEFYYNMGSTDICISFPEEKVAISKGTVLLVSTSAIHACEVLEKDDNLLFFMLRKSTFEEVFWHQLPEDSLMTKFFNQVIKGGGTTSYLQFETKDDEDIEKIITDIYFEYQNNDNYKNKMLNAMMSTFFILLLRRYENTIKLPRTKSFYWSNKFSAIISYIEANYSNLSLSDLANKFNYCEKQISRIIYKYIGVSYNQLILDLRMKRAAYLLSNNELSIEKIGEMIGYSTNSSFYRAFSSYYKLTPLEYRKKNIKNNS